MTATVDDVAPTEPRIRGAMRRIARGWRGLMPTGLFARSLLIIITPVILLQAAIVFVFTERHWEGVTERLTGPAMGKVAAIVDLLETYPPDSDLTDIVRIADDLGLTIEIRPGGVLPAAPSAAPQSALDRVLMRELERQLARPFRLNTGGANTIEIMVQLRDGVLRVLSRRTEAYIGGSMALVAAMVATSAVLLGIAILVLRNQIRPILTLTAAVDAFGKGRAVPDFKPRGAREVREAAAAFHDMRQRVERQIEQRTTMLAGVSHDLRTMLTRLRLQLALIEDSSDVEALKRDVVDMNKMLEGYLAFARGDSGEQAAPTDVGSMLDEIAEESRISGYDMRTTFAGDPIVRLRPQSFKRCIANLVANAGRHATHVTVAANHVNGHLSVVVDDDGPGIPPEERESVFRPFYRLDNARNLDESGTGLGLPIARDIARIHGGDIALSSSPEGGLRVTVTVPA
jgi:two-component system osmolarity sensor histidine kinase EnvZ